MPVVGLVGEPEVAVGAGGQAETEAGDDELFIVAAGGHTANRRTVDEPEIAVPTRGDLVQVGGADGCQARDREHGEATDAIAGAIADMGPDAPARILDLAQPRADGTDASSAAAPSTPASASTSASTSASSSTRRLPDVSSDVRPPPRQPTCQQRRRGRARSPRPGRGCCRRCDSQFRPLPRSGNTLSSPNEETTATPPLCDTRRRPTRPDSFPARIIAHLRFHARDENRLLIDWATTNDTTNPAIGFLPAFSFRISVTDYLDVRRTIRSRWAGFRYHRAMTHRPLNGVAVIAVVLWPALRLSCRRARRGVDRPGSSSPPRISPCAPISTTQPRARRDPGAGRDPRGDAGGGVARRARTSGSPAGRRAGVAE